MTSEFKVYKDYELTEEIWDKILVCEHSVFSPHDYHQGQEFKDLYKNYKEGVIAVYDTTNDRVVGFFNMLFLSPEQAKNLLDLQYYELKNIGPRIGEENDIYILALAIDEEYRGTAVIKILCKELCAWLDNLEAKGVKLKSFTGEAVLPGGVKVLNKVWGMKPLDESRLDKDGLGYYISTDCLSEYRKMMRDSEKQ